MRKWVSLDFETRSLLDVMDVGAIKYAAHPSTHALCASYAFEDRVIRRWRINQECPADLRAHAEAGGVIRAWNAGFEMAMWGNLRCREDWPMVETEQFLCSASLAARASLPRSLEKAAQVLKLAHQKDDEGHRLMLKWCRPRKPRKGERKDVTLWCADPEEFERLCLYCDRDVEAEMDVFDHLPAVGHPFERKLWLLDYEINNRGVAIDIPLIQGAMQIADDAVLALNERLSDLTQGEIVSVTQIARIKEAVGLEGIALDKAALRDRLAGLVGQLSPREREILEIRQEGGKSSLAKLKRMLEAVMPDDRIRGMLLYYGASTGRWAGRLVQPQNFPRPAQIWETSGGESPLESYVPLVTKGDFGLLDAVLPQDASLMDLLAAMLRGCFVAKDGHELMVADFSAIEARVLAWVAGAARLLHSYRTGGSAYLDMGRVIYGRPITKKDAQEYQVSKNTVLGCGYQMGPEKYQAQLAKQTGLVLPAEMCERAVKGYRELHFEVPMLWKAMNSVVKAVVSGGVNSWIDVPGTYDKICFAMDESGWLKMKLPSGRCLWYPEPHMSQRMAPWGEKVDCVTVAGVDSVTNQWTRQALYGGLLTENAIQAIARDLMAEAMFRVEEQGYPVILTVHDEIVTEPEAGHGSVDTFCSLMSETPDWAKGCPVAAEGWKGVRYRK